jgi:hypothetical protein
MRVAEKFDWKGLKIKKSVGNRSDIGSERVKCTFTLGARGGAVGCGTVLLPEGR